MGSTSKRHEKKQKGSRDDERIKHKRKRRNDSNDDEPVEDDTAPKGKKDPHRRFGKANSEREDRAFKPSTREDLRAYRKAGKRAERKRMKEKMARRSGGKDGIPRYRGDRLRQALLGREHFKIFKGNLFNKFIEFCKELGIPKPRYRSYLEPERTAQGQFIYEVNSALSRMNWNQMTELLHTAVTTSEHPVGVATRNWTEALSFVRHCLHTALGVVEKKGTLRLSDPGVLEDWPVSERRRKSSKEDDSMLTEELERRNAAMMAASRNKDEDDDEDEEDEDEDDEDEDEDEEGDEDEDEDDEDDDEDDERR
jgi:hypothetical protein